MTERMYSERKANIPAFRGCRFGCVYCEDTFQRLVKLNKKCPQCTTFEPHFHPEALQRTPPKTRDGEFITIGLSGDLSFANIREGEMLAILDYCCKWSDRIFLLQSKNPAFFLNFVIPKNVIVGTTIESDAGFFWKPKSEYGLGITTYNKISKAPIPRIRAHAMAELQCRKAITIEPILEFNDTILTEWILKIKPEIVWIGYDSRNNKLPEPSLEHTQSFVSELLGNGVDVRTKLMRKAWWEA